MSFRMICAVLLLNAAPLLAAPESSSKVALAGEEHLRAWIAADVKIQEKLVLAEAPPFAEADLKDSLSDRPVLKSPEQPECRDFRTCAVPPLTIDVPVGDAPADAILAMMRPWLWLADAKGVRLGVAHADPKSQALLAMNIPGVGLTGVGLNAAPLPEGGVHLWFSRGLELAAVYSRERGEILGSSLAGR
ncbi:MAG: hypothetical protein ACHQ2Z_08805 [Elusimicrobiota bacterium]